MLPDPLQATAQQGNDPGQRQGGSEWRDGWTGVRGWNMCLHRPSVCLHSGWGLERCTALEFLPGKMWYLLPPVGGLRFPSPELYSHMWSLSERASHLSFISCLLDTTCCNFSRICGAERGKSPGFSNAPYCPRQPQTASKSKLGHTVLDSSLCSAVWSFGVMTSSF